MRSRSLALVVFLGVVAVDLRRDRSAEHARLAAERTWFTTPAAVPARITAHYLFESLGIGAYYLAGSLAVLTFLLLVRREIDQPMLRTFGWAISVVGLTTLAALADAELDARPGRRRRRLHRRDGPQLLEIAFRQAGAYIFALSVLLAGLLLSTDYFLFRAAAVTTSVTGRSLLHVGHLGHVAQASGSREDRPRRRRVRRRS